MHIHTLTETSLKCHYRYLPPPLHSSIGRSPGYKCCMKLLEDSLFFTEGKIPHWKLGRWIEKGYRVDAEITDLMNQMPAPRYWRDTRVKSTIWTFKKRCRFLTAFKWNTLIQRLTFLRAVIQYHRGGKIFAHDNKTEAMEEVQPQNIRAGSAYQTESGWIPNHLLTIPSN